MRKITLTILTVFLTFLAFGQMTEKQKLIEISKTYMTYMGLNQPSKRIVRDLRSHTPKDLRTATNFIIQTITPNNKLLTRHYIKRPDDKVLKQLYIVRAIYLNLRCNGGAFDNGKIVDSLINEDIPTCESLYNYYLTLFMAVSNKNRPFDLSKVNFKMDRYNFNNDMEKGIFFLNCISMCDIMISGYINYAKPANINKAYSYIKKFPKFDGGPYYQYNDFYFLNSNRSYVQDKTFHNYIGFALKRYYDLLLSHLTCLREEGGSEDEINHLLIGSILCDKSLYKYSRDKKVLEELFKFKKVKDTQK
jgi:hypothetical protein